MLKLDVLPLLLRRQQVPVWLRSLCFTAGILMGLTAAVVILLLSGVTPGAILNEFVVQVFFNSRGLAQTITTATPLILVGLGAAAAMKLKFWNIGIEGQLWMGAIAATGIAIHDVGPPEMRLTLMLLAAVLAGAIWIAIPVFFKLRYGVNEIIMTLLMTYVAFLFVQHLVFGSWQDPTTSFPVSEHFDDVERLSRLGWGNAYTGIWIALGAGALMWLVMDRSRFGYYATAVGLNLSTARGTGLPVTLTIVIAVLLSGGLSGLAGAAIVSGAEYRLTQFLAHGYTFSGIVIAFIARFRPTAAVIAGLIIGGIYTAGETLKVFYSLSEAIVILIEGVILLSLLVSEFFAIYQIHLPKAYKKT
jgi:general nucleoside transport system permease protein